MGNIHFPAVGLSALICAVGFSIISAVEIYFCAVGVFSIPFCAVEVSNFLATNSELYVTELVLDKFILSFIAIVEVFHCGLHIEMDFSSIPGSKSFTML